MQLRPSHPEPATVHTCPVGPPGAGGTLDRAGQTLGTSGMGPQRPVTQPQNYLSFSIHDTVIVMSLR